ncbi:MAG: hypothetical protein JXA06_11800, partial [Bacteroidetes bacterium]|nr:hypothetical protein [Bacteroidota bacterium]
MKILLKTAFILIVVSFTALAQFRSQPEARSSATGSMIRQDEGGLLFGWFDPSRLSIRNSYSLSYITSGGNNLSLGTLTSSLAYKISDPLSLIFDVSLVHSPYSNLGGNFTKSISGVYLTRAELNYRPSDDLLLHIQFRQLPPMYWLNNFDRFGFSSALDEVSEEESH